ERGRGAKVQRERLELLHLLLRSAHRGGGHVHRLGELLLQVDGRRDDAADGAGDGESGALEPVEARAEALAEPAARATPGALCIPLGLPENLPNARGDLAGLGQDREVANADLNS